MNEYINKVIRSPYTGRNIRPQLQKRSDGTNVYTEGIYTCPDSGQFVRKVIFDTTPVQKKSTETLNEATGAVTGALGKLASGAAKALPVAQLGLVGMQAAAMAPAVGQALSGPPEEEEEAVEEESDEVETLTVVEKLIDIKKKIKRVHNGEIELGSNILDHIDEDVNDLLHMLGADEDDVE